MKIYNIKIENKIIATFTNKEEAEKMKKSLFESLSPQIIEDYTTELLYFENLVILNTNTTLKDFEEIKENIKEIISESCGGLLIQEELGTKKLAYKIKENTEGYYIITKFNLEIYEQKEADEIRYKLEKYFRENENVLKFLTIKSTEQEILESIEKTNSNDGEE